MAIGTPVSAYTSGVQAAVATSGALTLAALNTLPTSTNDCLVVTIYCSNENTSVSSFTGGGGTWTPARATVADPGTGASLFILTKQATSTDISGATYSLLLTNTSGNGHLLYTFSIVPGGTFDAVSDSGTGKDTVLVSGTPETLCTTALAPSTNADLFFAVAGCTWATTSAVTFSLPANYTLLKSYADSTYGTHYVWYRQKSSDSTSEQPSTTPTFTGTDNNNTASTVLAFKASAGAVGPISVSGFGSYSSSSTSLSVTDPNNTGTITATSGNTAIATVSPSSGTGAGPISFTVTGVSAGTTTITFADTFSNTHVVTVQFTPAGLVIRPYRDGPFARVPGMKRALGGWGS